MKVFKAFALIWLLISQTKNTTIGLLEPNRLEKKYVFGRIKTIYGK
jgi:hypothetical protein